MTLVSIGRNACAALAICFGLTALPLQGTAGESWVGSLRIKDAWSRQTPKGAPVGVGYMTIENAGDAADRLLAVACGCADMSEIHATKNDGGVMQMVELSDGLEIPAKAAIKFAPGGLHLMFIGLKAPFAVGETVEARLIFERAGAVDVELDVRGLRRSQ